MKGGTSSVHQTTTAVTSRLPQPENERCLFWLFDRLISLVHPLTRAHGELMAVHAAVCKRARGVAIMSPGCQRRAFSCLPDNIYSREDHARWKAPDWLPCVEIEKSRYSFSKHVYFLNYKLFMGFVT